MPVVPPSAPNASVAPSKELVVHAPAQDTVTVTTVSTVPAATDAAQATNRKVAAWLLIYYSALLALLGGAALWGVRNGWSAGITPPSSDPLGVVDTRDLLGEILLIAMLGGWLHGVSSLAMHTAKRTFISSWWLFYVTRPLVGCVTGLFVYLVLSGGVAGFVVAPGRQGVDALLAWAALAGLFSTVATQKLKDVLNALFRPNLGGPEGDGGGTGAGQSTTVTQSPPRPEVQTPTRTTAPDPRSPSA